MKTISQKSFDGQMYEIIHDTNDFEKTEYLQLTEIREVKARPVIFVVRTIPEKTMTVSMHHEGLNYEVFLWFTGFVNALWLENCI